MYVRANKQEYSSGDDAFARLNRKQIAEERDTPFRSAAECRLESALISKPRTLPV